MSFNAVSGLRGTHRVRTPAGGKRHCLIAAAPAPLLSDLEQARLPLQTPRGNSGGYCRLTRAPARAVPHQQHTACHHAARRRPGACAAAGCDVLHSARCTGSRGRRRMRLGPPQPGLPHVARQPARCGAFGWFECKPELTACMVARHYNIWPASKTGLVAPRSLCFSFCSRSGMTSLPLHPFCACTGMQASPSTWSSSGSSRRARCEQCCPALRRPACGCTPPCWTSTRRCASRCSCRSWRKDRGRR